MGRLSSCAKSKYETLISDKFYLHYVCTNSSSPSRGWRSQVQFLLVLPLAWSQRIAPRFLSLPGHTSGCQSPRLTFPYPAPSCYCAVLYSAPHPSGPAASPIALQSQVRQGSSGAVALLAPPLPGCLCFPPLSSFAPSSLPQRRRLFSKNVQR